MTTTIIIGPINKPSIPKLAIPPIIPNKTNKKDNFVVLLMNKGRRILSARLTILTPEARKTIILISETPLRNKAIATGI